MDVRQLRYFVNIVDFGSLGKAAEKLFVAQPSLSQQMARLEQELGVSLLLRSNHGVTPTAEGEALYRHARMILRQMEQLKQEVAKGAGAESGTVALGLPTTMAAVLAVPLFERLQDRYPGIRLQLFESMSGVARILLSPYMPTEISDVEQPFWAELPSEPRMLDSSDLHRLNLLRRDRHAER